MYEYQAKLHSVYDGDTIRLDIDLGFGVWLNKQTIRLAGIDAPELRGTERENGLKAKEALNEMLQKAKSISLRTFRDKKGKYGRWIAIIYADNTNVNEWMIENGFAKVYD